MITKETLFATRRDATPAQKMDLRLDVEVPAGTQLLKCHKMDDRWQITVQIEGKRTELITFRNPLGKTTGERLGPRFPLLTKVTLKRTQCGVAKGAQGVILDIAALDSFRVAFGGQVITVGSEFLSLHKVAR